MLPILILKTSFAREVRSAAAFAAAVYQGQVIPSGRGRMTKPAIYQNRTRRLPRQRHREPRALLVGRSRGFSRSELFRRAPGARGYCFVWGMQKSIQPERNTPSRPARYLADVCILDHIHAIREVRVPLLYFFG